MATVEPPIYTDTVNQEFFIESLRGAQGPLNYLEFFPETIYTHSADSNLVAFLYALVGPAGIGWLRQNYLEARIDIEEAGLNTTNLDALYANPLSFARTATEFYDTDPSGLLSNEEWEKIKTADSEYRNRAILYLKAVRAGGTVLGIKLAAESGLNRPVEVIENYKALYDNFSDNSLGLEWVGKTRSTEEVIIIPRQNIPTSQVQEIEILKNPVEGFFKLNFPLGETAKTITSELAYNASNEIVQEALEQLPVAGKNNVIVSGGPLPDYPITIEFTNELADRPLPEILLTPIATGENAMLNINGELAEAISRIKTAGVGSEERESYISPQDMHYMEEAINNIRPLTSIITTNSGGSLSNRVVFSNTQADSAFTEVLRYVTGRSSVKWPPVSPTSWIEEGKENEAPLPKNAQQQNYTGYHNISSIIAYTDKALEDPDYENETAVLSNYRDEHVGSFSSYQEALFPFLSLNTEPTTQFESRGAIAVPSEPLNIEAVAENGSTNLINGIYPVSYTTLPGISREIPKNSFWASQERPEGTDYLEIDLGKSQALNFISFEASSKPFSISVDYDLLDGAPKRSFTPITLESNISPSVTSLSYNASSINPWTSVYLNFTDSLSQMIYTRFIRIGFTRRTGENSPFTTLEGSNIPFSIEVRNIRLGRKVS